MVLKSIGYSFNKERFDRLGVLFSNASIGYSPSWFNTAGSPEECRFKSREWQLESISVSANSKTPIWLQACSAGSIFLCGPAGIRCKHNVNYSLLSFCNAAVFFRCPTLSARYPQSLAPAEKSQGRLFLTRAIQDPPRKRFESAPPLLRFHGYCARLMI